MEKLKEQNYLSAVTLAKAGYYIFPCRGKGKRAKAPLLKQSWRAISTLDLEQIKLWWDNYPDAIPAIDLGKSNLIVLDADKKANVDGVTNLLALFKQYEYDISNIFTVVTANNGFHFYFKQPKDIMLGNATGDLPKGVDVRGAGGYVIASGAILEDGKKYIAKGSFTNIVTLPNWIKDIITKPKPAIKHVNRVKKPSVSSLLDDNFRRYVDKLVAEEMQQLRYSATGTAINKLSTSAFNLGTLVGAHVLSKIEAISKLEHNSFYLGLKAKDVLATINLGLQAGIRKPRDLNVDI
ncbi:bifunctional DNA primase/polymerase [Bartonella sp. DGB1]|uniref:bifunctional DNA primase/polymerase n=1 Tax=Bartonella sp. DGB1 TaxID=3239807 RepID=UPI003525139C